MDFFGGVEERGKQLWVGGVVVKSFLQRGRLKIS